MEHKLLAELQSRADLTSIETRFRMTRAQRLERWIEALERDPTRRLRPLYEIEYTTVEGRRAARSDNSPLTVAYEDPVLRAEGLKSDKLGDVLDFFELTEQQAHQAFCSCHMGSSFQAKHAANRLRAVQPKLPTESHGGFRAAVAAFFSRWT